MLEFLASSRPGKYVFSPTQDFRRVDLWQLLIPSKWRRNSCISDSPAKGEKQDTLRLTFNMYTVTLTQWVDSYQNGYGNETMM